MTTLFEEADNTNPPSPSELLDAPSIKREVNGSKKIANHTEDGLNSGKNISLKYMHNMYAQDPLFVFASFVAGFIVNKYLFRIKESVKYLYNYCFLTCSN